MTLKCIVLIPFPYVGNYFELTATLNAVVEMSRINKQGYFSSCGRPIPGRLASQENYL